MADAAKCRSEDLLGKKWDRCISDSSIKFAGGVGLGIIFSVVFFRRRPWPVAFGAGVGLGMGYANCQHDFRNQALFHGTVKLAEGKKVEDSQICPPPQPPKEEAKCPK